MPKFDLPGIERLGGEGREIAFREVNRQSARKGSPRDPPLLGVVVENGFRKAAAVKIPGTDEKDPLMGVAWMPRDLNLDPQKIQSSWFESVEMRGDFLRCTLGTTPATAPARNSRIPGWSEGICLFHGMPLNSRAK